MLGVRGLAWGRRLWHIAAHVGGVEHGLVWGEGGRVLMGGVGLKGACLFEGGCEGGKGGGLQLQVVVVVVGVHSVGSKSAAHLWLDDRQSENLFAFMPNFMLFLCFPAIGWWLVAFIALTPQCSVFSCAPELDPPGVPPGSAALSAGAASGAAAAGTASGTVQPVLGHGPPGAGLRQRVGACE